MAVGRTSGTAGDGTRPGAGDPIGARTVADITHDVVSCRAGFDAAAPGEAPLDDAAFDDIAFDDVAFDDEPPPPAWVLRAAIDGLRGAIADAATEQPGGATAEVLERACPDAERSADHGDLAPGDGAVRVGPADLDAAGLLNGIVAAGRLISWAEAIQQRYIAALARPGVVMAVEDLLDLTASPLGLAEPVPDIPITALMQDPKWNAALRDAAVKVASAELGGALNVSPIGARNRTERAVAMVDTFPATLAAQQSGEIDGYRASIIAERMTVLDGEHRRLVEQRILPIAARRTPSRLRALVDREVVRVDPDAAARREQRARSGRGVRVDPDLDGMARFCASLPAPGAQMAYSVLDRIATTIRAAGLADGRGQNQLRADAFLALFADLAATGRYVIGGTTQGAAAGSSNRATDRINGVTDDRTDSGSDGQQSDQSERNGADNQAGAGDQAGASGTADPTNTAARLRPSPAAADKRRLPICVNVYISASTLAGLDDDPAELAGHGVISAEFARSLATSATAVRAIVTTPVEAHLPGGGQGARTRYCGTVFDAGHLAYRPPERIVGHVTARDRVCCFPGCRTRAERCDIDHRTPFERSGVTCPHNLDALCRFHHMIKTFTPWHAVPGGDGTLVWTAPTGHVYSTEPGHLLADDNPTDDGSVRLGTGGYSTAGPGRASRAATGNGVCGSDPPPF